jgi:hypothetical protein
MVWIVGGASFVERYTRSADSICRKFTSILKTMVDLLRRPMAPRISSTAPTIAATPTSATTT